MIRSSPSAFSPDPAVAEAERECTRPTSTGSAALVDEVLLEGADPPSQLVSEVARHRRQPLSAAPGTDWGSGGAVVSS
eukprot:gene15229-biopygen2813